ncbi:putative protein-serine/threonine phosphatase [Helianthus annuus]|uniref:Putative PPP domain-containing protein n=1 Tax=Helianthus annuus TaxID=4232 RepID=A0A251RR86_HELAN|nr:putative protein-serine/threonine phosphatase [Helianthus annuus]KAJ0813009.1 putative protein-serine/threonine phosphatase [Helianthus annuus]
MNFWSLTLSGTRSRSRDNYAGARIEGGEITLDFMKKMTEDFNNKKMLHKRDKTIQATWEISFEPVFRKKTITRN